MIIDSVKVRNLLSFGPKEPLLVEFRKFNLFIGRNGSGKTNLLRILGDLKTEFSITDEENSTSSEFNKQSQPLWKAKLSQEFKNFNLGFLEGDLTIKYISPYKPEPRKVVFENGYHVEGDFKELQSLTTFIGSPTSNFDLGQRLEKVKMNSQLAILNFGLKTIFGREIGIREDACFFQSDSDEPNCFGGQEVVLDYPRAVWPSGYLAATSILLQFLSNKHIILIEEPERFLEPISCRYLIRFLIWLTLLDESSESLPTYVEHFMKDYSERWREWISRCGKDYEDAQDFSSCINTKQIFFSSHAPHLIQEFLALDKIASIHEFNLEKQDHINHSTQQSTLFTSVRPVKTDVALVLDNIGASGSDLLQANGVIWVEGPSDVIYISQWIEMFTKEHSMHLPPRKGIDFQFQMYGGSLLDFLGIKPDELNEEENLKKLVDMFSFSRNAFVVIDSDCLIEDGVPVDKSSFETAKKSIYEGLMNLKDEGYKVGLWYEKDNPDVPSIESYLDEATIKACGKPKKPKVRYAQKVVKKWEKTDKKFSDFNSSLESRIKELVECIDSWNARR